MLANTYTDPDNGMSDISQFAISEFARHCKRDYKDALVQAVYQAQRHPDRAFPSDVRTIMSRGDVADYAETAAGEAWGDCSEFATGALEMLEDLEIELNEHEQAALVSWLAIRDAAHFFKRRILNFDAVQTRVKQSEKEINIHAREHGALVSASCPADYFFETLEKTTDPEVMRLFRCVVAVRSLVGSKDFTGTTKDMIRARMVGAKSPAVAEVIASNSEPVRDELDALSSRKRFDRILTEGAVRKFYGKFGAGRRVYLSLSVKDPAELSAMVARRFARHADYKTAEQQARVLKQGTPRGHQGGSKGGSFNKTLNKTYLVRTVYATSFGNDASSLVSESPKSHEPMPW